ncbi:MAG: pilin [Candidatus Magasanikbacteria bacterium]
MSKKHKILFITLLTLFLMPSFVLTAPYTAKDSDTLLGQAVGKTGVSETDITQVGGNVLKVALSTVGLIFFIIIFYGGFRWLLARGNEEEITKAKNTVIGSIIGLLIVLGAYSVTLLINNRLIKGQTGTSGTAVPGAVEGDPVGCCLDRWETEGGFFGVGQSGWTGTLLTKAQCDVVILQKEYPSQKVSASDGQWLPDQKTKEECQNLAKDRDEKSKWEQSSKWE